MKNEHIKLLFDKYCKKLRITPCWDVKLEIINDSGIGKTGDIKLDCTDRKAVVIINLAGPHDNYEEVIVHELMHIKMYPLDQITESLITSNYDKGTNGYKLAYSQFFTTLEQTVEELSKCFLLEFGENKDLSFGRCDGEKSFDDLYNGLKEL